MEFWSDLANWPDTKVARQEVRDRKLISLSGAKILQKAIKIWIYLTRLWEAGATRIGLSSPMPQATATPIAVGDGQNRAAPSPTAAGVVAWMRGEAEASLATRLIWLSPIEYLAT